MTNYTGTTGDDTWFGSAAADLANGGAGGDRLFGYDGADTLNGQAGDDYLVGGGGADVVNGGAGNDLFGLNATTDIVAGDRIIGGTGIDAIFVDRGYNQYDLTAWRIGADVEQIILRDASARVTLAQLSGFSLIEGVFQLAGSGTLDLTGDRFVAGSLFLDNGNDIVTLAGNRPTGFVSLSGGGGNDRLIGSAYGDGLSGGAGNDHIEGGTGDDYLVGDAGDDVLLGGDGQDIIDDDWGADVIEGGAGDDRITINFENGFSELDRVSGGDGIDTLTVIGSPYVDYKLEFGTGALAADFEIIDAQYAHLVGSASFVSGLRQLKVANLTLTTGGTVAFSSNVYARFVTLSDEGNVVDFRASPIEYYERFVYGGAGADTAYGHIGGDHLLGGGGNDVLRGLGGADVLVGGAGADLLDGGAGDDLFIILEGETITAGDRFIGGSGYDTLSIDPLNGLVNLTAARIAADIEEISGSAVRMKVAQLTGFSSIHISELRLADGGVADFRGKDTRGTLFLSDKATSVFLSDTGFYQVTGGAAGDTITGGAASDRIIGGGGNDVIDGGTAGGYEGADYLGGDAGDDVITAAGGNDRLDGGVGNDTLAAGGGNDFLWGGAGNDRLDGGTGNDVLIGGAGDDHYIGGAGIDTASLGDAASGVTVSLLLTTAQATGEGTDIFEGIENLAGSRYDDVLTGRGGANELTGGDGNDRLSGVRAMTCSTAAMATMC